MGCSTLAGATSQGWHLAHGRPEQRHRSLCTAGPRPARSGRGRRAAGRGRAFSSTSAATGRQLKQSVNVFQSRMLYRRLHSS